MSGRSFLIVVERTATEQLQRSGFRRVLEHVMAASEGGDGPQLSSIAQTFALAESSAEGLLDMSEALLRAQAAGSAHEDVRAALLAAALRLRAMRLAKDLLKPARDPAWAIPAFLLQLASAIEASGLACLCFEQLEPVPNLPLDTISVLSAYAINTLMSTIEEAPAPKRAHVSVHFGQTSDHIELKILKIGELMELRQPGDNISRPIGHPPRLRLVSGASAEHGDGR